MVAIIGILAAVAIPKFAQMIERAKEGATKSNLRPSGLPSAFTTAERGAYPTSIASSAAFVGTADSNYMQGVA